MSLLYVIVANTGGWEKGLIFLYAAVQEGHSCILKLCQLNISTRAQKWLLELVQAGSQYVDLKDS